jgi:hypothetical protein
MHNNFAPTPTKFGRIASPPPMQLHRFHVPAPASQLKEVAHQVALPVLDQEDLFSQGIDTSQLVTGAVAVDALGSCTCQSGTAHIAERWVAAGKDLADLSLFGKTLSATDSKTDEEAAILLYHAVTDQTGNPASEWPPTDCGSSGYYVCTELERLKVASSYTTGAGVRGALSLLQTGTVMQGFPWFRAWMTTDSQGFVDGHGGIEAFVAALESGVAGGHETLQVGIPQLAVTKLGHLDLGSTVIECLNSWSTAFGLNGRYRIHASTLDLLSGYADFKQITV